MSEASAIAAPTTFAPVAVSGMAEIVVAAIIDPEDAPVVWLPESRGGYRQARAIASEDGEDFLTVSGAIAWCGSQANHTAWYGDPRRERSGEFRSRVLRAVLASGRQGAEILVFAPPEYL